MPFPFARFRHRIVFGVRCDWGTCGHILSEERSTASTKDDHDHGDEESNRAQEAGAFEEFPTPAVELSGDGAFGVGDALVSGSF